MPRGLFAQMLAGSLILLLVIGAGVVVLVKAIDTQRENTTVAGQAQRLVSQTNALERQVIDLQTGSRGFLITADRRFLRPYQASLDSYPAVVERLREEVRSEKDRRAVDEISARIDSYATGYLGSLQAQARRNPGAAREIVKGGEGERRVNDLRQRFDALDGSASRLAASAGARSQDAARRARQIALVGAGVLTAILAGFIVYLFRNVLVPVRRLGDAAAGIEAGDLATRIPPHSGRVEDLNRMSGAFNRMADSVESAHDERLEAERIKDEFFALISHELRTPLTAIVGYAEILLEEGEPLRAEQQRKFIDVINRNSRRLLRLVGDMLFIARMEAGRMGFEHTEFDLTEVVNESIETFQSRAKRGGVDLVGEVQDVGTHTGDSGRIGQAIDNLISNAIKFTPRGGTVTVRALRSKEEAQVIEVVDTGSGISAEDREQIFERFFRTHDATKGAIEGTGLGLSIVKAIVDAHGGKISIDSEPGEETTFRIRLPS